MVKRMVVASCRAFFSKKKQIEGSEKVGVTVREGNA